MIKVKLFGLLRLDSGVKEFEVQAASIKEISAHLQQLALQQGNVITEKNISSCAVLVNGQQAGKNIKLKDGDQVIFMSMVAGG